MADNNVVAAADLHGYVDQRISITSDINVTTTGRVSVVESYPTKVDRGKGPVTVIRYRVTFPGHLEVIRFDSDQQYTITFWEEHHV